MKKRILEITMAVLMLVSVSTNVKYALAKEVTKEEEKASKESPVIVVDAGHGGIDPGKVSKDGTQEKDINLAIANILASKLKEAGYTVVMTRTDDNGLYSESDSNKKVADMKKRCSIIDESKAVLAVSIHQNSYQSEKVSGAQVFYYKHSANGKKLAEIIQKSLKNNVNENNTRQAKYNDSYYLLLHTACPTVIVECGFLSNANETELLKSKDYQAGIADAIYLGIEEYLK